MVLKAVADGVMFEVCYGITMRSSATADKSGSVVPKDARRNVIAGARELIRITNGKGVILSSQVKHCMEMRAPLDLCNFGTIIGLKPEQSKATVSDNARLAVIRGYAHRGTYRGVISNPVIVTKTKEAVEQEDQEETSKGKRKRNALDDAGR
jgi:ribonuclease P/MRP protein subunit RPP1